METNFPPQSSVGLKEVNAAPGRAPYTPLGLIGAGLLLGPLGVGILGALNWRRLGRADRFWFPIIIGIFISLVGAAAALMLILLRADPSQPIQHPVLDLIAVGAAGVVLASLIISSQKTDYDEWVRRYGKPTFAEQGGLFGLLALVGIAGFEGLIVFLLIWPPVSATLIGGQGGVYQASTFSLTYPAGWVSNTASCQRQPTCLLVLDQQITGGRVRISRFTNATVAMTTREMDKQSWAQMKAKAPDAESEEPELVQVGGRETIHRSITYTIRGKLLRYLHWWVNEGNGVFISILAIVPIEEFDVIKADIQALVNSFRFATPI